MIDSFKLGRAALVGVALSFSTSAFAAPAMDGMEMRRALAKAEAGPTELRRYIERTKPIYLLDYAEVMKVHLGARAAAANAGSSSPEARVSTADAGDRK